MDGTITFLARVNSFEKVERASRRPTRCRSPGTRWRSTSPRTRTPGLSTSASSATARRCPTSSASPCTPVRRSTSSRRRSRPCAEQRRRSALAVAGRPMLTIQAMPNLSVSMPNSSPHICFSSGIVDGAAVGQLRPSSRAAPSSSPLRLTEMLVPG